MPKPKVGVKVLFYQADRDHRPYDILEIRDAEGERLFWHPFDPGDDMAINMKLDSDYFKSIVERICRNRNIERGWKWKDEE